MLTWAQPHQHPPTAPPSLFYRLALPVAMSFAGFKSLALPSSAFVPTLARLQSSRCVFARGVQQSLVDHGTAGRHSNCRPQRHSLSYRHSNEYSPSPACGSVCPARVRVLTAADGAVINTSRSFASVPACAEVVGKLAFCNYDRKGDTPHDLIIRLKTCMTART